MNPYVLLAAAILAEVVGTTSLKLSAGFTRPLAVLGVVCGYGLSLYLLGFVLDALPVGLVYGTWSAGGILAIAAIGIVVFGESLDVAGLAGIGLIVTGVFVLTVVSETAVH